MARIAKSWSNKFLAGKCGMPMGVQMDNKTFISVEFWQIVGFLLSFLGVCWGFGKMLLVQYERRIEVLQNKVEDTEKKLNSLIATLPLNYVLREDYIRGQAVLEAKMDALHKTLSDLYKLESTKK